MIGRFVGAACLTGLLACGGPGGEPSPRAMPWPANTLVSETRTHPESPGRQVHAIPYSRSGPYDLDTSAGLAALVQEAERFRSRTGFPSDAYHIATLLKGGIRGRCVEILTAYSDEKRAYALRIESTTGCRPH